MAFTEGNKLFAGGFRDNLDGAIADIVQFTKRCNWKLIIQYQGNFCRKFSATNVSSAQKNVYLQGWCRKFI